MEDELKKFLEQLAQKSSQPFPVTFNDPNWNNWLNIQVMDNHQITWLSSQANSLVTCLKNLNTISGVYIYIGHRGGLDENSYIHLKTTLEKILTRVASTNPNTYFRVIVFEENNYCKLCEFFSYFLSENKVISNIDLSKPSLSDSPSSVHKHPLEFSAYKLFLTALRHNKMLKSKYKMLTDLWENSYGNLTLQTEIQKHLNTLAYDENYPIAIQFLQNKKNVQISPQSIPQYTTTPPQQTKISLTAQSRALLMAALHTTREDSINKIIISDIPARLCCPVSKCLFDDPVIASDGFTYSRASIEGWFSEGGNTSPTTRRVINTQLIENTTIADEVSKFIHANPQHSKELNLEKHLDKIETIISKNDEDALLKYLKENSSLIYTPFIKLPNGEYSRIFHYLYNKHKLTLVLAMLKLDKSLLSTLESAGTNLRMTQFFVDMVSYATKASDIELLKAMMPYVSKQRDSNGNTLLHHIVAGNNPALLNCLDISKQYFITNKDGDLPLHSAVRHKAYECFRVLSKKHPETIFAQNKNRRTALELAETLFGLNTRKQLEDIFASSPTEATHTQDSSMHSFFTNTTSTSSSSSKHNLPAPT